jgi:cell division protease FtsH
MVSFFGMSEKVGNISFYDSSGQSDFGFTKPYSEKTAEVIDQEVKNIIEESYQRAIHVLEKNLRGLTELAELLLEKEVIFSEDLERIFGKRKADIIREENEASVKLEKQALPAAEKNGTENGGIKTDITGEEATRKSKVKKNSDKIPEKKTGGKSKKKK